MKITKYIFGVFLLVLSIGEILPIYLLSSGLIAGQSEGETLYFLGKLAAHVLFALVLFYFGLKIINRRKENEASATKNT